MYDQIFTILQSINYFLLIPAFQILRNWWWFFFPFIIWGFFIDRWLWWRNEIWLSQQEKVFLELKIPQETEKPIRAMETVMANLHAAIYQPPGSYWEIYIEGQLQSSLALEIVSIEGEIHFYMRFNKPYRDAVESAFYAQFPDIEIVEAEDYTQKIPLNIPNQDWDLWGADYKTIKPNAYPIKTYKTFETERESKEEQKIDPVAGLLEALAKVGPKEQLWIQMVIKPASSHSGSHWIQESLNIRDKLAKRPEEVSRREKPILIEAFEILIKGLGKKEPKPEAPLLPPEMKMTPGEREVVAAIENKASKQGFETFIRFIFLGKKGYFNKANLRLPFIFFSSYVTENMNALYPLGDTITKIHYSLFLPLNYLRDRRKYLRQRKMLRNYLIRVAPFFPRGGGKFILNTEEIASLFHFPSWKTSPVSGTYRVQSKTKPPSQLP